MIVNYSKRFIKQTNELDEKSKKALASAIKTVKEAKAISDIPNCRKLSGHKQTYRIRISKHRAIFVQESDTTLFFQYIAKRSEAYKKKYMDLLRDE